MKDAIYTALSILAIFVALPFLILWLRDKLFDRPMTKEQMDEYSCRFRERLANSDLGVLERHFGCHLPVELKQLYANSDELARDDFEVIPPHGRKSTDPVYVAFYNPADDESLKYTFHDADTYFAFADDGCGNAYIIDPREADPPVLFHDHETGEIKPVAPTLSEFMKWERRKPDE
jgi:hypothetical protein